MSHWRWRCAASFVALAAQAISRFDWVFCIFGAFLIYTAWKLATSDEEDESEENAVLVAVRRVLPIASGCRGASVTARIDGKWFVTPSHYSTADEVERVIAAVAALTV